MPRDVAADLIGLARSSVILAPALLVPGAVNLALFPLLTRAMSVDTVGTYALVAGLIAFAPIATSFWLESAIVRYGYVGGPGLSQRDLSRGRLASIAGAAGLTLVGTFVVTRGDLTLAITAAAMAMIVVRFTISLAPLRARAGFGRYSLLVSTRSILGLPLAFGGALAAGPLGAIVGQNISQLGLSTLSQDSTSETVTNGIGLRRAFAYGMPVASMNVAATALSVADRYIIDLSRTLGEVAVYAAAYVILEQIFRLLPAIASTVVAPTVYRWWAAGDRRRARAVILAGLAVVVALESALLLTVLFAGDFWSSLLGSTYGSAGRIALPLGLGLLVHAASQMVGLLYTAQERVRVLAINFGIAALLNVGLNLLVVPTFGIVGAAWVTCATYILLLILNVAGQVVAGSAGVRGVRP